MITPPTIFMVIVVVYTGTGAATHRKTNKQTDPTDCIYRSLWHYCTDRDLLVLGGELLLRHGQRRVGRRQLTDELGRLADLGLGGASRLLADLRLDANVVQLRRQHRRLAVEQRQLLATTVPATAASSSSSSSSSSFTNPSHRRPSLSQH